MKAKYICVILTIVIVISLCTGFYYKKSYLDFNGEENALDNFAVALIGDEFLQMQLEIMESELDDSNYIMAVRCADTFEYRYACVTQKVEVLSVFKGDNIKEGDEIEIARAGTLLDTGTDSLIDGKYIINMGFVNEMIPGKTYLIFLDRELNTYDDDVQIYIQSEEIILAPIFCYDEIVNEPKNASDEWGTYIAYRDVKDNEFFVMSDEASEKIGQMKEKLFEKYNYSE